MLASLVECCLTFTTLVVTAISGIVLFVIKPLFKDNGESEKYRLRKLVQRKQAERQANFDELRSSCKLGPEQNQIVNLNWEELTEKLQKKELSATAVLQSYIAKALELSERCNPVTDFIADAHVKAKQLDEMDGVKGPLHGIPFAVKDDTSVEGLDNTHGYAKRLYKPSLESAAIVKVLEDLGGIPFCKTNVPQTLFTFGSDNPIFGTTTNCHNSKLSPGGSSSGSGALVGGGGAMFATGTDIGGSLRIPAHFNGASSIKPTVGRVASKGFDSSIPNVVGVDVSLGIIGRTPTVVAAVTRHMLENGRQTTYDANALPIQWDTEVFESRYKLRIGYFTSIPYFPTMGDTAETVLKTKAALESLGHTLISVEMPDGYRFMKLFGKFVLADHARHFKKCWRGEEIAEGAKLVWIGSKIPVGLQKVLGRLLTSKAIPFLHSKRSGVMFGAGASSSTDLWDGMGEKRELINEMLSLWESLKLDAVIGPVMPFPAPLVDAPGMLSSAVAYCVLWNLVDFPAGVVTMAGESGKHLKAYDDEGDMTLKFAKKNVQDSIGAPIGIQVVAKPYKEELVLRLMQELEKFNTFKQKANF